MQTILSAAGGLGIFLLAMAMMTDGLKLFGGDRLKRLLERWTSRPVKAVLTGALVTGLVQSSSAVTVATIGFVNAGILTLHQSLGVIFGANVGTTMTGWLVSLVGFGFKIEALALPFIAVGMALRVAASGSRLGGLGQALTGFGLFFLGLAVLKEAFAGLADQLGTATLGDAGIFVFLLIGFGATVLTQSSSAAIALILTAASQSAVGLGAAAAAIIGANVGTTSTAVFAALNATPNARRVAAGHILFNVCTGAIALALLPVLLWLVSKLGGLIGQADHPAAVLALFHTVFNLLGVFLLVPFLGPITTRLERIFTTAEEDISRPQYLDATVATTPALAQLALHKELMRMQQLVCNTGTAAGEARSGGARTIGRRAAAILQLGQNVRRFAVTVRMEGMSRELAESLPRQLRMSRYLEDAAERLVALHASYAEAQQLAVSVGGDEMRRLLRAAHDCLAAASKIEAPEPDSVDLDAAMMDFEADYQEAKAALLRSAATHRLSIEEVDRLLDDISGTRRLIQQLAKATRMLLDAEAEPEDSQRIAAPETLNLPQAEEH